MRRKLTRTGRRTRSTTASGEPIRSLSARFMAISERLPRPWRGDASTVGVLPGLTNQLSLIPGLACTAQASRILAERVAHCPELIEAKFHHLGKPCVRAMVFAVVEQSAAHPPQNQLRASGRHLQ